MSAPQSQLELNPSKAVLSLVERAVQRFHLIESGDRVAVAVSGGKDSLLLIATMRALARRADLSFTWGVVHLDQKQPGFDYERFRSVCGRLGVVPEVIEEDTHAVVQTKLKPGQIPCSICGRMRRGILNRWCAENGFNKLALGHHLDDGIETFFLNLMYGRSLAPLKAATPSDKYSVTAIRPLILVDEAKIVAWIQEHGIEPVACPVCDTFPASKRRDVKAMLAQFEAFHPKFRASVRDALYSSSM